MGDSPDHRATLYFMCGKMAAGKSTCAKALARTNNAALFVQDALLATLYPGEILDLRDFVTYSTRLRDALFVPVRDLLSRGTSVVLDFPANTTTQRDWFRDLLEGTGADHALHYVDVPDDVCKRQLKMRSEGLPAGSPWTTDAEFDAVTAYFQAPADDEGFNVVRHARG